jgi:hypothetical protein
MLVARLNVREKVTMKFGTHPIPDFDFQSTAKSNRATLPTSLETSWAA